MEGLSSALPCFYIEQKTGASEGVSYPYFSASRDGRIQLSIIPKADGEGLHEVVISGGRVHNTLGHPIGSLFKDVFVSGDTTSCRPGMEELSGFVLCRAPSAQNIVYMFAGSWEGPDGEMPPGHVLGMWPLIRISWTPGGDQ